MEGEGLFRTETSMSSSSATSRALRPERTSATALSLNSWVKLRLCFFVVVIGVRLLAHLMSHFAVQAQKTFGPRKPRLGG